MEKTLNEYRDNNYNIGKDEKDNLFPITTQYELNHPLKLHRPALGPYYQFITTDLTKMLWIGSALIFRHVAFQRPNIQFISDAKIDYDWEILYENIFNMRAYRINLSIELRSGDDDEIVRWEIDWGNYLTNGLFHIAQYNQKWRGAFFSCNGFDSTLSKDVISNLSYGTVWNHLHSVHQKKSLHLLIWGGDHVYHDSIFEDVPFLKVWRTMNWDQKWTTEFDNEARYIVEQYYFNDYAENFEYRLEIKKALESIPSLMMWDDHDIFDGAGSYPSLMRNSPIMIGLFGSAQKMRLLFQHHTTPLKARRHHLFGYRGYNVYARCGPNLAILGADGRTERNDKTVQHRKTWNMIFKKLDNDLQNVKHLIVVFPIPFSFARYSIFESILQLWKTIFMKWHNLPFGKKRNPVFDLSEFYDGRLDKWTHRAHLDERNHILIRFQAMSQKKRIRVTFFSGDVHCCGITRFRTRACQTVAAIHDTKLMYQVVSSAIVNKSPSLLTILGAHYSRTKWYPNSETEEELINFFDKAPNKKSKLFMKKILPNRNWCYFEQCVMTSSTFNQRIKNDLVQSRFWSFIYYFLTLIGLSWIIDWAKQVNRKNRKARRTRKTSFSNLNYEHESKQEEQNYLHVRLWLENTEKPKEQRTFTNYDLTIPYLE